MKPVAALLFIALLALSLGACDLDLDLGRVQTKRPTKVPRASPATATPPGTWEMVIWGTVYDASSGLDKPVAGARVTYDQYSYQGGGIGFVVSDERGRYEFALLVHDTDTLAISVEEAGFAPYSQRSTGMALYAGGRERRIDLGLTPLSETMDDA